MCSTSWGEDMPTDRSDSDGLFVLDEGEQRGLVLWQVGEQRGLLLWQVR